MNNTLGFKTVESTLTSQQEQFKVLMMVTNSVHFLLSDDVGVIDVNYFGLKYLPYPVSRLPNMLC